MINVYAKATPLPDVKGRVSYISSTKRQENLVAVYGMTDKKFWAELSDHCQKAAAEAGHTKVCEGREWHAALPNVYAEMYRGREEELAKELSEMMKEITGTENMTALHWNKRKTNFHVHFVCSENPEVNEISYGAVLTRNTYFDAEGKRSNKKDCVDPETKELLPGCELVPKGKRKMTIKRFGAKANLRTTEMSDLIKDTLAVKFNRDLGVQEYRRFLDTGLHLRQQHIGKNLTEEQKNAVEEKNEVVKEWNAAVDQALKLSMQLSPRDNLTTQKYLKKYRKSFKQYAMTENWTKAIAFSTKKIQQLIAFIRTKLQERMQEQERPIKVLDTPGGLDAALARAEKIRAAQPRTGAHGSGDDFGNFGNR